MYDIATNRPFYTPKGTLFHGTDIKWTFMSAGERTLFWGVTGNPPIDEVYFPYDGQGDVQPMALEEGKCIYIYGASPKVTIDRPARGAIFFDGYIDNK